MLFRVAVAATLCASLVASASNSTLQLVQVLFRHGARTPVFTCPSDTNSASFLAAGLGQLTNEGKMMQYELGKFLRHRYADFLNEKYHRNYTHVRSSDVDRTLESALANLAGLYPPKGQNVWNPKLPWQPIPVHTVPEMEDQQLNFIAACARFHQELKHVLASDELRDINAKNQPLYDYLSTQCGAPVRDIVTLSFIYDLFLIESRTNLTLPTWATAEIAPYNRTIYPDLLYSQNALAFSLLSWDARLRRLGGGPLLAVLTDALERKVAGILQPDNRQLIMFSGHDSDIAALLGAMGVYTGIPPTLASCVIFELHRDADGGYFVKMFYRNDSSVDPYPLRLPGCTVLCPWEAFRDITAPVRPDDVAQECSVPSGVPDHMQTVVIALATCLALLLVVCLMAVVVYCRARRNRLPSYSHFGEIHA